LHRACYNDRIEVAKVWNSSDIRSVF
jgi:hypothetical protein